MGGAKGSGASKTALTRYKQFYKHYGREIPEQYKEELNKKTPGVLRRNALEKMKTRTCATCWECMFEFREVQIGDNPKMLKHE